MTSALFAWLGVTDIRVARGDEARAPGPVARAVESGVFDRIELLSNYVTEDLARGATEYVAWLRERAPRCDVRMTEAPLANPTDHRAILEAATRRVDDVLAEPSPPELTFLLNPGTPSMHAVWLLLAKSRYGARLVQTEEEPLDEDDAWRVADHLRGVDLPVDISADFHPELLRRSDGELTRLVQSLPPDAPEFDSIVHRCTPMKEAVALARQVAPRGVSVLVLGESGTGKDLFARAIHEASDRSGSFVKVNCGAIPEGLAESELFGHVKGAFTGAVVAREGHFRAADGGTLFLDEVGELPLEVQVKLLRVLQSGELTPVGGSKTHQVNVRVVAATHRDLPALIREGRFREDLFYRLAVWVMKLPPLRERGDDVGLLIDHLVEKVDEDLVGQPGYEPKRLSAGARNLLKGQPWTGNVRELHNVLTRASLWTSGPVIGKREVEKALDTGLSSAPAGILGRPLAEGFQVQDVLDEVARHYVQRALDDADGVKRRAASALGLGSATTLSNWMARLGLPADLGKA